MSGDFWLENDAILRRLWAAGASYPKIAAELGIKPGAVTKRRIRLGLPQRGAGFRSDLGPKGFSEAERASAKAVSIATRERAAKDRSCHLANEDARTGVLPESRMLTLAERKAFGQCAWPYGDPLREDFRFCAADCEVLESYCVAHRALAYVPRETRHNVKNWRAA